METKGKMKCPHCGMELNIDELILSQMDKEFEEQTNQRIQEAIRHQKEENKKEIEEAVRNTQSEEAKKIEGLMMQIQQLTESNQKANEEMGKLMKQQLELQEKLRTSDLEVQRKVNEQAEEIYAKAKKDSDEANEQKIAQLNKKIEDANKVSEDLQKKLDQSSQQLQGEVQELKLEECLRLEFPLDDVREIEKGKNGADVIQTVKNRSGKICGVIVWESKSVKTWKNEFIPKLRSDMEREDGNVGILVSSVFGKSMEEFTMQDGVWLVKPENVLAMARIIRDGVVKASDALAVAERKETVQDAVYAFVTSAAFRNRIENIGRQYRALEQDIVSAKDQMERHWKTQRALIDQLVENTQGILGDVDSFLLQAGPDDMPKIDSPESDDDSER